MSNEMAKQDDTQPYRYMDDIELIREALDELIAWMNTDLIGCLEVEQRGNKALHEVLPRLAARLERLEEALDRIDCDRRRLREARNRIDELERVLRRIASGDPPPSSGEKT